MTAIKQVAITSQRHLASLAKYLDFDREKVLGHASQNLTDERDWAGEMDRTREIHGHNEPARAGAKTTYMYHQILAFNPDECSCNGGKMTPRKCLGYAEMYVRERYPDQEAVLVLHEERCKEDGTSRYAVHMGINRTELTTGKRHDEGIARKAQAERVATVRGLDERWGLRQLERGRKNSRTHGRQPSARERQAMRMHGDTSNERVRRTVARRVQEVAAIENCPNRERELSARLREDGITMTLSRSGDFQFRYKDPSVKGGVRKINGTTLGTARSKRGIALSLSRDGIHKALYGGKVLTRLYIRALEEEERERNR